MAAPEKRKPDALQASGIEAVSKAGSPEHSANKLTRQEKWRRRNPLADWAHSATRSAMRRGLLTKPNRCEICGAVAKLDAHHPDHHDPLTIVFACRPCHKAEHARLRQVRS